MRPIIGFLLVLVVHYSVSESLETSSEGAPMRSTPNPSRSGRSHYQGDSRAMGSLLGLGNLDPIGMWKSASRMVRKGVHVFRESLHEGIKVAHMLRDDVGEGVTHILSKKNENEEQEPNSGRPEVTTESAFNYPALPEALSDNLNLQVLREGMIGGLLRFMKVDSNQLGIMALNVLIFVAEMISQSLLGKGSNYLPESKEVQASILQWLITGNNAKVENLLKDAKSHALPENLIETLKNKTGNQTACVQLLICKMSPLIWGVQKTLEKEQKEGSRGGRSSDSINPSVMNELYDSMPSQNGFVQFGDECEQRFPTCKLLKYNSKKNNSTTTPKAA